ncbi:aldehyde dehydrogenase family protein [Microbacteriaceae bacterium VKM Ac-2854]|nr:aldehyde dehydrogenase family protein [Microbacteriaceae bacterium VKM Ac-2854]
MLIAQRSRLTAAALVNEAAAAAERLVVAGILPRHRVAITLDETADAVVLLLALARVGCSVLVVDPRQFVNETAMVAAGRPDHVVRARTDRRPLGDLSGATRVWPLSDFVDLEPGLISAEGPVGERGEDTGTLPSDPAWWRREDGLVLFSSGSTSGPTPVAKRPADVVANGRSTAEVLGYREDDALQPLLPLSHQYGFSVLMIGLDRGIPVIVSAFRRPLDAVRFGRRWGATVLEAAPESYGVIARAIERGKLPAESVESLRLLGVGGGIVPRAVHNGVFATFGRALVDGYGSTEWGNVALADPAAPSAGLRAMPGIGLRVLDPDGAACPDGAAGRLELRLAGSSNWHDTGDLATIRADGTLSVLGRFGAINRNGLLVHPSAVEHRLGEAGINAVTVAYGTAEDARYAVVVEDRIRRLPAWWSRRIAETVAEAERPDRVLVRAELPRTVTGKPDRARLRLLLEATVATRPVDPLAVLADGLLRRRAQFVDIMTGYSARPAAEIEFDAAVAALRGAATETVSERPAPVARSWVYLPSNVVLYSYVLYLLIPSAWTGRAVFRPSSRSRVATLELHAALEALHPSGIEAFEGSQREFERLREGRNGLVVFTGRHGNAEQVRSSLGVGHVMAYFGQGTNPMVVGADADIMRAARDVARMRLLNSGQDCFGPDLVAVHHDRAEAFLAELDEQLRQESLENLLDAADGRVRGASDALVLHDVVQHVSRHRSALRSGGRVDLRTGIIEPTVLTWPMSQAPTCSEVFAPVFNVLVYRDEAECIRLLDSDFYRARHMGASLYGTSEHFEQWCAERMTVAVGATLVAVDDAHQAFGGMGEIAGYLATRSGLRTGALLLSRVAREYAAVLGVDAARDVEDSTPGRSQEGAR